MKPIYYVMCLLIPISVLAQERIDKLNITNKKNNIYAIIYKNYYDSLSLRKDSANVEALADFIYHSKELKKRIIIPVKLFITTKVTFCGRIIEFIPKKPFVYIFIRKGKKMPLIIKGVQSWSYLEQEVSKFFGP